MNLKRIAYNNQWQTLPKPRFTPFFLPNNKHPFTLFYTIIKNRKNKYLNRYMLLLEYPTSLKEVLEELDEKVLPYFI